MKTYECISDVNRTQTLLKLARVCNELYDKLLKNKTIMKNCCFTMKYEYDVKDIIKCKTIIFNKKFENMQKKCNWFFWWMFL